MIHIDKQTKRQVFLVSALMILAIIFLINVGFVSAQESFYCAEKTLSGASCINVPLEEVNKDYRYERTSCESTSYCSTGTCVNTVTGECLPSPAATCDASKGGVFNPAEKDEVQQCQVGCCLFGDSASLVERGKCDAFGKDYNVQSEFRQDITNELTCIAMATPEAKGACTFETESGIDCDFITKAECQNAGNEFHEGFLCTAVTEEGPLSICSRTERTTCVEGRNEVYFVDSCGNIANVYDANKIDDVAYWSYVPGVEGVEVDLGDMRGNIGSDIYGACSYLDGSTCGPGNAEYGNFICQDLGCQASDLTGNERREHGDAWCSQSISSFEDAKPGELSYLLYCSKGEVKDVLCDNFRNSLCKENEATGSASCVANRWLDCALQENTRDCLDTDRRDCRVVEGASAVTLRTQYGTEKQILDSDTGEYITGTCVPKYTPGFKFWDPEGTLLADEETDETPISICEFASVTCFVPYTQEIIGITDWRRNPTDECINACESDRSVGTLDFGSKRECYDECTPVCLEHELDGKDADAKIVKKWAESYQNLCVSLGDCGVGFNYLDEEGYNRWRDLFTGEKIDWNTLPNAGSRTATPTSSGTAGSTGETQRTDELA